MRWLAPLLICAGCQFSVIGTSVGGDPAAGGGNGAGQQSPPPTGSTTPPPPASVDGGAPTASAPDMADPRIGTPCMSNAQCDTGLFCAQSFFDGPKKIDVPGGYCTRDCSQSACPSGSVCATFNFGKFCQSSCPPDPCRGGYMCCDKTGGGQTSCTPGALCMPQD